MMLKTFAVVVAAALVSTSEACGTEFVSKLRNFENVDGRRDLRGSTISGTYCSGTEQSPIDLPTLTTVQELTPTQELAAIEIEYEATTSESKMILENLGGTIEVVPEHTEIYVVHNSLANSLGRGTGADETYQVAQFHFHWDSSFTGYGSEHYRGGEAYPIEMHIVTFNTKYENISVALANPDGLLVIGVFGSVTEAGNDEFGKITSAIEDAEASTDGFEEDAHVELEDFSLEDMIASIDLAKYDTYKGSLTTPSCNQVVSWVVMHDTLGLTEAQIEVFQNAKKSDTELIAPNYRELQDLNDRTVYRSQSPADAVRVSPVIAAFGLFVMSLFA